MASPLHFSPIPAALLVLRQDLPLFSTAIRAGFPSPADDFVERRLDLNDLVKHREATYFAWVEGDSMIDLGIQDGDLLMIDKALEPESGDIVVAELGGEFTVKKLSIERGKAWLVPGNPAYPRTPIDSDSGVMIWGVVLHGTTVQSLLPPLRLGDTTTTGLRLVISGSLKSEKSQIRMVP